MINYRTQHQYCKHAQERDTHTSPLLLLKGEIDFNFRFEANFTALTKQNYLRELPPAHMQQKQNHCGYVGNMSPELQRPRSTRWWGILLFSPDLLKLQALLLMGFLPGSTTSWKFRVCSDQSEFAIPLRKKSQQGMPTAQRGGRLGRSVSSIRETTSNCNNIISMLGWNSTRERIFETDARCVTSMCLSASGACFTGSQKETKPCILEKYWWDMGSGRWGHRGKEVKGSS